MSILSDIIELFAPRHCAVCGEPLVEGEHTICTLCRAMAPLTGYEDEQHNPMAERCRNFLPVEQASALLFFVRESRWRGMIHAFKYHHQWRLARTMGAWMGRRIAAGGLYADVDAVVAVPLHPLKRCLRGYNQSEYLAEGIARELHIPLLRHAVKRSRWTQSQARRSRRDRARNVARAFSVKNANALKDKHILLVDDVFTTGSTLLSLAEAILAEVPSARISIAALAVSRHELGLRD